MPCLQFKPGGQLPVLPSGFTLTPPGFAFPNLDGALCCKLYIPIPLPPIALPPATVNPAFLGALNAAIGKMQAYLDQLDAMSLECPLE